jgi:hypothetical protein
MLWLSCINSSSAPQLCMQLNHSICGLYYLEPCCLMVHFIFYQIFKYYIIQIVYWWKPHVGEHQKYKHKHSTNKQYTKYIKYKTDKLNKVKIIQKTKTKQKSLKKLISGNLTLSSYYRSYVVPSVKFILNVELLL